MHKVTNTERPIDTENKKYSCVCAFDGHQDRWPWMTFNRYKFEFPRNFAGFRIFMMQQLLNEWR